MNIEKDQFRKKIKIFSLFFAIPAVFLQIALLSFLIIHLLKHELVNYIEVATVLIIFSLTACFIVSFFYTINWFKKTLLKLITEYKALCKLHEQVLSEKDELIRKIIYATPVGLLLLERDNIKWCNDYALSLFGIKNNVDLNTIDINSFFKVSEGYKDIKHFFPSKLMEEELIKFDTLLINASGSTVDVHIEATALDKQLPLKGIVLSITDISWQKKAETELRQQLNFFQTLINTIPSPIFYKDSSFRFRGCNKEFEKFIGSKSEDIIGKTVYEITPKKYADIYNKADLELLEKGGTQTYESKIVYSDGSLHDVFFNKSVYFDAYGNKAGIIGIMLDITNIKRMETIISSQEVLYQRIFDESPLGKSMVNINNFKFIKVNNSLCSMLQYTRDELLNLTVFDVTHPDDTYISEKYIKGLLNGEYDYAYFEKRYIRKDGEIIWVKLNISLIEFGDEPSIYALNIIEDISLQKKALEDVRLFRNALDKAGESIFLINPYSMKVIDVNQRACLVYGYSKDELVNRDIKIICLDADNQIFSENIKTLLNEPEKVISFRTKNQRQNSTEFPVEISMSSTIFENRPIAVLTVRDITERNRLERELIITREKAIEASRLKSEFVANMSHEIRTPLNGIIGIIDLLAYSGLNNEQSNLLKTLKDSSNTLLGIINDILDFSKIEAGKLTIDHDLFETRELIENAVDVFSAKAYEKGLQLAVYINKNIPSKLEGPQNRTKQILLNLINNAIKFTDEGYVLIEVNVEDEEDNFNKALGIVTLRFEITDTGIGMDEKTLSRIFQPFVQADSSSSRQHAGTGLGLYISKKLIELMGGDIKIESQFKKGSSFKFTIPFLIPKYRSENELFCKILPFNTLIISDREQEALVILKYLNDMGMKSQIIESCQKAIDLFSKKSNEDFQIVILNANHVCKDNCKILDNKSNNVSLAQTRVILIDYEIKKKSPYLTNYDAYIRRPVKKDHLYYAIVEALTHEKYNLQKDEKDSFQENAIAQITSSTTIIEEPKTPKKNILLAEDNLINQKVATMQLNKLGYHIDIANNGKEVLEKMRLNDYDLILMDCQMPILDGYETTKRIRLLETRSGNHIPIIAMTANAMEGDREKCISYGMDDYISKPVNIKVLEDKLKEWIH